MIFSSLQFICVFLPVVFLLYSIIPNLRVKNLLLIAASIVFYAYGEPKYVLLLLVSSIFNWVFALIISKQKGKKLFLALAVILNLGMLAVFKYLGFFTESVNSIFSASLPVFDISLPVGISFFSFQALSYVIDVYRGQVEAKKNYFDILLYISFFPQLIAGPIVKFHDIEKQIASRKQSASLIAQGLRRFAFGLSKKVILANTVGMVADSVFALEGVNVNALTAWAGAAMYTLQIYFDFSGYSDMAIGLGKMFGFSFKENFDLPYTSATIREFWRRWHISLSTWFKEYLYIPLGGNRKGRGRTVLNKWIVFLCTGLWHGANWTFVLWGALHGLFITLEEFVPVKKLPKLLGRIYTIIVVCITFTVFRADDISQAWLFIKNMFTGFSTSQDSVSILAAQFTPWVIAVSALALLFAGPLPLLGRKLSASLSSRGPKAGRALGTLTYAASFLLLAFCIIRLSGSSYNPFLYFRF